MDLPETFSQLSSGDNNLIWDNLLELAPPLTDFSTPAPFPSALSHTLPETCLPSYATPSEVTWFHEPEFSSPTSTESRSPLETVFPWPYSAHVDAQGSDHKSGVHPSPSSQRRCDSRKARKRAIIDGTGVALSDPDQITSHEKKRYYLQCLEEYVVYLHEQIRLAGYTPCPMEKVLVNRGLSSRSIQTLLAHMSQKNKKADAEVLAGEQSYMQLQEEYFHNFFLSAEGELHGARDLSN